MPRLSCRLVIARATEDLEVLWRQVDRYLDIKHTVGMRNDVFAALMLGIRHESEGVVHLALALLVSQEEALWLLYLRDSLVEFDELASDERHYLSRHGPCVCHVDVPRRDE